MSIGVHMQCYKNDAAVAFCIQEFRKWYPKSNFRLVSDGGNSFESLASTHNLLYKYESDNILPKGMFKSKDCVFEYFKRIYETCISFDDEWIVIFEDDVFTKGTIISFPPTDAGGMSMHPFSKELCDLVGYPIGYGMCGGSIFKRKAFIECYENLEKFDLEKYTELDKRVGIWTDLPLTLLFLVNGFTYSVWNGVDQPSSGIHKIGSAFEHNFKKYYV